MLSEYELRERYDRQVSEMPDIIEWVCSDKYLNRGDILYPRQATLLKLIFLQDDLMTEYDLDVLGEWSEGFELPEPGEYVQPAPGEPVRYEPSRSLAKGIAPDWQERVKINKAEGRLWFREVLPIIGRRGSKGYMGAICGSRVLAHYITKWDPQEYYGIARNKRLEAIVFAGKMGQARDNQWRDLVDVLLGSPWFQPLVSNSYAEKLTIYAPSDFERMRQMKEASINTRMDLATFEIVPKESTLMAGRGMASFLLYFDEMAHIISTGANRSAEEVYESSVPSLDQFGKDGFIYTGSSPWQMTGRLYENYLESLSVDPLTGKPTRPEMLMVQLESWDPYEDWDIAHQLHMVPRDSPVHFTFTSGMRWSEGKKGDITVTKIEEIPKERKKLIHAYRTSHFEGQEFPNLKSAPAIYDDQMARLERANPDTFRVERRSQWAAVLDAYLDPGQIDEMFGAYQGKKLNMQRSGALNINYVAHGDPSVSGDNFGFAIAHADGPDDQGLMHVVFDYLHAWIPSSFPDSRIDYIQVQNEIIDLGMRFHPTLLSFDQFSSAPLIQAIGGALRNARPNRTQVWEHPATAQKNWQMAETFKTALNLGLIHAPFHELADAELRFLQLTLKNKVDHPTAGPVQSKDVADAMFNCVWHLIGTQMSPYVRGDMVNISGSQPGGLPMSPKVNGSHERLGEAHRSMLTREQRVIASRERWSRYRGGPARS